MSTVYAAVSECGGTSPVLYENQRFVAESYEVPLSRQPGRIIGALTVREQDGAPPLTPFWYEKGYNNGCYDKVPLAAVFAERGYGMVTSSQSRGGILRNPQSGEWDALRTLAFSSLDVIESRGLADGTLPLVSYSGGAMVAALMVKEAGRRGLRCFTEAPVVMLAPMGLIDDENPLRLTFRGLRDLRGELGNKSVRLPALDSNMGAPETLVDVAWSMTRNFPRAVREYGELSTRKIRLLEMAQRVGWLSIGVFGEDSLVPAKKVESAVARLFAGKSTVFPAHEPQVPHNVSYFMPYSMEPNAQGRPYGASAANHMDPFSFPGRLGSAVVQQLDQALRYHTVTGAA